MTRNPRTLDWVKVGPIPFVDRMAQQLSDNLNQILKETSRAFYLSLVLLPPGPRRPLSLAYLLARAADTVADSEAGVPVSRSETLKQLKAALLQPDRNEWERLLSPFRPDHPGERKLLGSFPRLVKELQKTDPLRRDLINEVVSTLVDGMVWDQELFSQGEKVRGLAADQLDRYTYLVAGCVGPFWSEVCALDDRRLDGLLTPGTRRIAVLFGQALQRVNILRDVPRDQAQHRFYLPPLESAAFRQRFLEESRKAVDAFRAAVEYPLLFPASYWRHRLAVFLPLVLGLRTLERLFRDGGPRYGTRVKVSRVELFYWLTTGALCCWSNTLLSPLFLHLLKRTETALNTLEVSYA